MLCLRTLQAGGAVYRLRSCRWAVCAASGGTRRSSVSSSSSSQSDSHSQEPEGENEMVCGVVEHFMGAGVEGKGLLWSFEHLVTGQSFAVGRAHR